MLTEAQVAELRKLASTEMRGVLADRDELVRRLAAYRKWAIQPWPRAMTAGTWWKCRMCGNGWEGAREKHGPDCPAAPVAAAPVEDATP